MSAPAILHKVSGRDLGLHECELSKSQTSLRKLMCNVRKAINTHAPTRALCHAATRQISRDRQKCRAQAVNNNGKRDAHNGESPPVKRCTPPNPNLEFQCGVLRTWATEKCDSALCQPMLSLWPSTPGSATTYLIRDSLLPKIRQRRPMVQKEFEPSM